MKCPSCGAETTGKFCEFCGSEMPNEKTKTTINITNNYYGEAPKNTNTRNAQPQRNRQPQKSKSPMWLWVLGWIFFFPAPVMVLVWRKQCKWSTKTKIIFTAVFWLIMILLTAVSGTSSEEGTTADTESVTESNAIQVENIDTDTADANVSANLEQFFVSIPQFDIEKKELEELAKSNDLYFSSKSTGTGKENYKIATDKDLVDQYSKSEAKGSYVFAEYDKLNRKMLSISYFNYDKFYKGEWIADSYTVIDYNSPDNLRTTVSTLSDIVNYIPVNPAGNNLLEELFLQVTSETTKDEVMAYVEQNGLYYITRGAGNESHISYTKAIGEKYGEDGTTLVIDFNNEGYLTELMYYEYPVVYKTGTRGYFYSNEYNQEDGYFTGNYNEKTKLNSAQDVISAIHDLR